MTLSGYLVINKEAGLSSHAVVGCVRRLTGQKKAGHTGTLDPFATGVLPVALGDATRTIQFLDESNKEYRAVMRLGETTDTQDCTGTILMRRDWSHVTASLLQAVVSRFTGPLQQIPPMYSAIKQNGVPLYRIARNGGEVPRDARDITIYSLDVEKLDFPDVTFAVRCSRGTYVRTLASDIGESLGCGAHLVSLSRIRSGPFTLDAAVSLEQLALLMEKNEPGDVIIHPRELLSHLTCLELDELSARRITNGVAPGLAGIASGHWPERGERVQLQRQGELLAVAEGEDAEHLRLLRVFV